ncbi:hypothetical protein G6O67_005133 [Ophiocordyceps sinensis]|uniref:Uncharacterized protein n=1 Tax=Ophiocordyceps sinensis TaxID=72228 RepID=A0A8H4PQY4_9HYPO|nr:hypothetical protein G6O67_005133 [Ophiocordyceps sinensis]
MLSAFVAFCIAEENLGDRLGKSPLAEEQTGSATMASRRARNKKMTATNDEDGSRIKPDDADSRPANTRSAMAAQRGRGRGNGSRDAVSRSVLNPESNVWVPKAEQVADPNVRNALIDATIYDIGSHDSNGLDHQVQNATRNWTADGTVHNGVNGLDHQVENATRNWTADGPVHNGVNGLDHQVENATRNWTADGPVHNGVNGLDHQVENATRNWTADGPNGGTAGAKANGTTGRVPVKARANTIATAGVSGPESGLFEQMTFHLLNETLRNGNGFKTGTS